MTTGDCDPREAESFELAVWTTPELRRADLTETSFGSYGPQSDFCVCTVVIFGPNS